VSSTAKAWAGRLSLGHDRLSNTGGGIERLLSPPDEQRRVYIQPCPRHPLGCDGGFWYTVGKREEAMMTIAWCPSRSVI